MASPIADDSDRKSRHDSSKRSILPSKPTILRYLTNTQNTSALVFSVFLGVHIASPVVAVFSGVGGADQTMMIARDLYLPLEPYLIYIPLITHLSASLTRRLILFISSSTSKSSSKSSLLKRINPHLPRQTHQILAYPLFFLLIPHIFTHRLIPSSPSYPISQLSPSELGWEFVGYNLNRSWLSWISYTLLVGSAMFHSIVGGMKVVSWLKTFRSKSPSQKTGGAGTNAEIKAQQLDSEDSTPRRVVPKRRKIGLRGFVLAFVGFIVVGLVRVARESSVISPIMKRRYEAVFSAPWSVGWR